MLGIFNFTLNESINLPTNCTSIWHKFLWVRSEKFVFLPETLQALFFSLATEKCFRFKSNHLCPPRFVITRTPPDQTYPLPFSPRVIQRAWDVCHVVCDNFLPALTFQLLLVRRFAIFFCVMDRTAKVYQLKTQICAREWMRVNEYKTIYCFHSFSISHTSRRLTTERWKIKCIETWHSMMCLENRLVRWQIEG